MNFSSFYLLSNTIQIYPWGSKTAISDYFGIANPKDEPQAEIWMGSHPNGCSKVLENGEEVLLSDFIKKDASGILGAHTIEAFGGLPYLFKVLAANQALSIQVHPSKSQAEKNFALESQQGIDINCFNRNYKDENHKPELVFALTNYKAMNGFRQFKEIVSLVKQVNSPALSEELDLFYDNLTSKGLERFFRFTLELKGEAKELALYDLLSWARSTNNELGSLIVELNEQWPKDIGLFSPLMFNVLELVPGEAMFLEAGTPHAYIRGLGLEVMASSDNVLRAGLTSKYVDVDELVKCCNFKALDMGDIKTESINDGVQSEFPVPVEDFKFSVFSNPTNYRVKQRRAEIIFAVDSEVILLSDRNQLVLKKGESAFIPLRTCSYSITSEGMLARCY
ncbi:mannose-6-phosphate isomerase, class I [Vibrio sp. OPT20]|uniref:mannose-6-phosphate isomerase, class I n=1 Tax=Vibrio sp. OPT20 TaxID=2778642 RepID=UPI0018800273|nr:mannose-6-phosphate isomerase, class I [Vibrio sp. OPT20]MBE8564219.1 mannose-6-phosphate isomerase, class I [Vibrio sp. OPT20]